jgi:hypothetical protein
MAQKIIDDCLGYQQITVLSASVGLTLPTVDRGGKLVTAKYALLRCETQNVRFRDDGTAPTAGVGMLLITTDAPFRYDGDLTAIRFIEATASAKLNVCYYA